MTGGWIFSCFSPRQANLLPMLETAQQGFQAGSSFACSACGLAFALGGVATGDFNKDGNLDVVLANTSSGSLVTLLGRGDGTFRSPVVSHGFATELGSKCQCVEISTATALPDLVVSDGGEAFQTAFGNGDGSFRPGSPFQSSSGLTTTCLALI